MLIFTRQKNLTIKVLIIVLSVVFLLAVEIFAEDAQYHFQRGHRFYLDSKPSKAEAEFKKALQLNPQLPDANYYLGSIYFKQKRYTEAIRQLRMGLKTNPRDLKSLIILGLSLQEIGLNDEAINVFQKARRIDNQSAAVHSALGLAYCAKGELEKAKKEYNILRQIDPELAGDLWQRIKQVQ